MDSLNESLTIIHSNQDQDRRLKESQINPQTKVDNNVPSVQAEYESHQPSPRNSLRSEIEERSDLKELNEFNEINTSKEFSDIYLSKHKSQSSEVQAERRAFPESKDLKFNLSKIIEEEEIKLKQSLRETQVLQALNDQMIQ